MAFCTVLQQLEDRDPLVGSVRKTRTCKVRLWLPSGAAHGLFVTLISSISPGRAYVLVAELQPTDLHQASTCTSRHMCSCYLDKNSQPRGTCSLAGPHISSQTPPVPRCRLWHAANTAWTVVAIEAPSLFAICLRISCWVVKFRATRLGVTLSDAC